MSVIEQLSVGPIVGYTTTSSARLFGRGDLILTSTGFRRNFGIARVRKHGESVFGPPQIFKMNPNFDFTGITQFDNLTPDCQFEFQMGHFYDEREPEDINLNELAWDAASVGKFKTNAVSPDAGIDLVFGSCRYLLKLFKGLTWLYDDRGDKIFRSISDQIENGEKIDQVMMLGDQIYADDLNLIGADNTLSEYNERYRVTFSQQNIRKLMSSVPTYMILDDHEIEDNWPAKSNKKDYQDKYPQALHAYQSYQLSHSPALEMIDGKAQNTPDKYWYCFENGCSDFFVMDTRTERFNDTENPVNSHIVGNRQLKALKDWLDNGNGKVKFVISGVPFFPDLNSSGIDDKWGGYLIQRTEIIHFIRDRAIRGVVFLSGDVHCSFSSQLICKSDPSFKVTSIISSSFFWPYPHETEKNFQLSGTLKALPQTKDFEIVNVSEVIADDNFTRLSVTPDNILVRSFDRKGSPLGLPVMIQL